MTIELLSRVRLFSSFSAEELSKLYQQMETVSFSRSQSIFNQGDSGDNLFIIRSGKVKIFTLSPYGKEVILAVMGEGDIFGELSVLDGQPRSASATAIEAAEVLSLDRDDFLAFLRSDPEAAIQTCIALADRLRRTDGIVGDIVFLDLPARLAKLFLDFAAKEPLSTGRSVEFTLTLNQSELANMVGTTRQSVNRVLSNWQDAGFIRLQKQSILILDPAKMKKRFL